jgi:hypothetical protein
MPRYLVDRTFPDGLHIAVDDQGVQACDAVVGTHFGALCS